MENNNSEGGYKVEFRDTFKKAVFFDYFSHPQHRGLFSPKVANSGRTVRALILCYKGKGMGKNVEKVGEEFILKKV
jgi:hypothetical protein